MPELLDVPLPHLDSPVAQIGDALVDLIATEPAFAPPAFTEVGGWDLETLLAEETFTPPLIAVMCVGIDLVPDGSNRQTRLETIWEVLFVRDPARPRTNAERWLSPRLATNLWQLLERDKGVLYGEPTTAWPGGRPLTVAIARMQRTPVVRRLGATGFLAQPVRFVLQSFLDASTGELYDG